MEIATLSRPARGEKRSPFPRAGEGLGLRFGFEAPGELRVRLDLGTTSMAGYIKTKKLDSGD